MARQFRFLIAETLGGWGGMVEADDKEVQHVGLAPSGRRINR